ncbi:MAG TPA: hypothetical protein VGG08_06000 [Solirubrobacteraceae bacterium]
MSADGTWKITVQTPMGAQASTVELSSEGGGLSGTQSGNGESGAIYDASVDGDSASWKIDITRPLALTVTFTATIDGDAISGTARAGAFGSSPFSGTRA